MFASVTNVRGADVRETARIAGESLLGWLRGFEGYKGLLIFAAPDGASARLVTLWESRDAADRSAQSRAQMRDSMVAGAGVELESVELLELVLEDRP